MYRGEWDEYDIELKKLGVNNENNKISVNFSHLYIWCIDVNNTCIVDSYYSQDIHNPYLNPLFHPNYTLFWIGITIYS